MWFKNIQVYKLLDLKKYSIEELESMLKDEIFTPCGEHDTFKTGWDFVIEKDPEEKLVQKVGQCFFVNLKTEEKIIPNAVVKERLADRVEKFQEDNDDRKPSKNEKEDMKTAIILDLAKNAFSASKFQAAYIDYENELLFVDSGSPKKAEDFISHLRMTFGGSFEASPIEPEDDVAEVLSSWMRNHSQPKEFDIGNNCDLKDIDGGTISVKKHDIDVEEITQHLDNGKQVTKMELVWQKHIRFSLTNKFEIKGIKMEDMAKDTVSETLGEANDAYNVFQANMTIMTGDFAELTSDLLRSI